MSLFPRLIFCRSLHTQRPTVARSLFMSLRHTDAKHKELSTEGRGPWAQRWPLKDVCGLHPVAVALPPQAPGSSLFWRWPFTKLPKHVQTGLQLSIANTLTKWLVFNCCQIKTSPVWKVGAHCEFGDKTVSRLNFLCLGTSKTSDCSPLFF